MTKVNPVKLHKELKDAGLPVTSVTSDGRLYYSRELNQQEKEVAAELLKNHNPYDRAAARRKEYLKAGIDAEVLAVALWEKIIEGNDEAANTIQAIREQIKAQIPPSA